MIKLVGRYFPKGSWVVDYRRVIYQQIWWTNVGRRLFTECLDRSVIGNVDGGKIVSRKRCFERVENGLVSAASCEGVAKLDKLVHQGPAYSGGASSKPNIHGKEGSGLQQRRIAKTGERLDTVWILGDQLNRETAALKDRQPGDCRILMVVSRNKLASKRWHRQRLHLVLSAMAHFAEELRDEGFEVDYREAESLRTGLDDHRNEFNVAHVWVMEPMSYDGLKMLEQADVSVVANNQFLCHYSTFASWAERKKSFKMEDFYRWQRMTHTVLLDPSGEPVGGTWNYDHDNREPPPKDGRSWPQITRFELDELDRTVLAGFSEIDGLEQNLWGSEPDGTWPVTRSQALQRLDEFVDIGLDQFGAYEDAMLGDEWKLSHSVLASSMNLGMLHPEEVIRAVEAAYNKGKAPINSVEGFIRQVIGWREYVWGIYWLWMPDYRGLNELNATRPVPPAFTGQSSTDMNCVSNVVNRIEQHGYAHHIERLMVLGNLALTSGVNPQAMMDWMWASFVDGAEWVMVPNVVGMALYADGGRMSTKPYASGGAYINRMSDSCKACRYNPKKRTGDDACPFTTLYWDFLARHENVFAGNHRLSRQLGGMRRLSDLSEVRERASEVLQRLDSGTL